MATNKLYYTVTIYKTLEFETNDDLKSSEVRDKARELAKTLTDVGNIPKGWSACKPFIDVEMDIERTENEERCRGCDALIDQTAESYGAISGGWTHICYICSECGKNVNKVAVCPYEYDEM